MTFVNFARVVVLSMFVWPYIRSHMLCTQLVICLFIHPLPKREGIWIKCDKRQMTSCIHKMSGRTYGQTNMKRVITLTKINIHPFAHVVYSTSHLSFYTPAPRRGRGVYCFTSVLPSVQNIFRRNGKDYNSRKINHPWNRYDMLMLRSWSTKIPNMNKMRQKTWLVAYTRW
jgi:hypothetical protein